MGMTHRVVSRLCLTTVQQSSLSFDLISVSTSSVNDIRVIAIDLNPQPLTPENRLGGLSKIPVKQQRLSLITCTANCRVFHLFDVYFGSVKTRPMLYH